MLSKKAKYGIKALMRLARQKDNTPMLIGDIAKADKLPKKFLETILLELKNIGILSSKMGKGGGYYLLKPAADINLADVTRHFDGALGLLPCVTHRFYEPCEECPNEELCGLRSVFKDVRDETVNILKNTSIADLVAKEDMGL
jgi:Rrf2 family protein